MRIKMILIATVVAALAIGVSVSNAALQQSVKVNVKVAKPGAAGSVSVNYTNQDDAGIVPQRTASLVVTSKVAKWNSSGAGVCKSPIPVNPAANNVAEISPACPSSSKVGKGTFTVNTGTVGQPIPAELGTISGNVNVYNYKPAGGSQAALLFEILSDSPVQNAHEYTLGQITRSGTLSAKIPNTTDLAPALQQFLTGRTTSLTSLNLTIKSPKVKKGKKPLFTLKNTKNLDIAAQVIRDNG